MPRPPYERRLGSMVLTLIESASELQRRAEELSELRDEMGVLSITVGVEPGAVSGRTPAPQIAVENELARLRHDGGTDGHLLESRLDELSERLEELLAPTGPGRGRALYLALASGAAQELALERALSTRARLGPAAHVLPLLAVLDEGRRTGLVSASRDSVSVSELELGRTRELERIELEPWVGDWWPEMKGPARANPQRGQQVVSQRERYERRLAAAYRHTLDDAATTIGALAAERAWARAVLAGDPRLLGVLDAALGRRDVPTATLEANLEGVRAEEAHRRLEAAAGALVAQRQVRLAEEVVAAETGVCGLVRILGALAEGRVDELLIVADRTSPGVIGPGERLAASGPAEETSDLTDLIVARALATGAAVTPLSGEAGDRLRAYDGIAARLRW
jgi:hypothetical protein